MKQEEKPKSDSYWLFAGVLIVFVDIFLQYYFRKIGYGVENKGISFGLASNWAWLLSYITPILLVLVVLVGIFKKSKNFLFVLTLCVGGVGNIVARFLWGSVWDYIEIGWLHMWINLSDVLISFSVLSYILIADESDNSL